MALNERTFLATTGRGVARAIRHATGWSVELGLTDLDVRCLAADPHQPGVVYAGTQGQGVWRSGDGGVTWQTSGLEGQIVKALAASPLLPGVLYAGLKPALLYVSYDFGATWSELSGFRRLFSRRFWFSPAERPFMAYVQAIGLSPVDPQMLLAGIEAGAVVQSSDGGETWSDHRPGALRDCHNLQFHRCDGDWAYEAGGSGVGAAMSHDGGRSWQQPRDGLDRHYGWAVAADPVQPKVWYVATSPSALKAHSGDAQACIYRSLGIGRWQKLDGGLPQPLAHMPYALLTDPAEPGHVYAGLSNGEVWHSTDYGDEWHPLPFSLKGIHRTLIML